MRNVGKLLVISPSDREIAMIREFAFPRARVVAALTTPSLLKRWLHGPPGWELIVCEMDLRVGGSYRYVWRSAEGKDLGMGGTYKEVNLPEKIVATEEFDEPWYPGKAVGTMLLAEVDGKTTLTNKVKYASSNARDEVLRTPMDHGVAMGYDALEQLLASPDAGF